MTLCESITEFSMWAIAASPLIVTTPIFNCSATTAESSEPRDLASEDAEGPTGERRSTVDGAPERKIDGGAPCTVNLTR